jgi:hypothetical protein
MGIQFLKTSEITDYSRQRGMVQRVTTQPTVQYLVIAGGGGGSLRATGQGAGGGGAGGYRTNVPGDLSGGASVAELSMPLIAGTYPITVGAGGAATPTDNSNGGAGSYSAFANIVSIGGGFGTTFARAAILGGSGGGGWQEATTGSAEVPQQGFKGGNAVGGQTGAAGGGGAGATGATVTSASGSAGGAGLSSLITGSSTPRAGGGGGGGASGSGGAGGTGGGGAGSIDNNTSGSGQANTGSGGGGGETGTSGAGGSGIVIFSVPTGTGVTFSANVTAAPPTTVDGRQVYVVTNTTTTSETVTFS